MVVVMESSDSSEAPPGMVSSVEETEKKTRILD